MDNEFLQTIVALLPFVILLLGFLVFKMNALRLSLYVWLLEIFAVVVFFHMPVQKTLTASVWGNITIWNGFLVLWTGQIFGQCFRSTGALNMLLNTLDQVLPSKTGKAVTLCSVVGGYLGAFNGFATYPVTIPGLVRQGIDGFRAAVGYLVYFSWSIAFVSLFIAAATLSFLFLWLYSKKGATYSNTSNDKEIISKKLAFKAFLPLIVGSIIVIIFSYPLKAIMAKTAFKLSLWGYAPVSINLINTPGTYILITALLCYVFAIKKTSTFTADFIIASKRGLPSLITLFLGGAMVNLMLDTGQITLLARHMTQWGSSVYGLLLSGLGFLAGMAFGQGIPACAMFSKMQMASSEMLHVNASVLVGLAAMVTMGPANPLKPSLLQFTSSLANITNRDSDMFNLAFKWQLIQLFIICVMSLFII